MRRHGSRAVGPSADFLRLLKGEITAEEWARGLNPRQPKQGWREPPPADWPSPPEGPSPEREAPRRRPGFRRDTTLHDGSDA